MAEHPSAAKLVTTGTGTTLPATGTDQAPDESSGVFKPISLAVSAAVAAIAFWMRWLRKPESESE